MCLVRQVSVQVVWLWLAGFCWTAVEEGGAAKRRLIVQRGISAKSRDHADTMNEGGNEPFAAFPQGLRSKG